MATLTQQIKIEDDVRWRDALLELTTQRTLSLSLVVTGMLAFTIYFVFFALRLYNGYFMHALDMGNMDQAVWQTSHGRPFYFTNMQLPLHIEAFGTDTRLSFHVEPILLPIAVLYRIVAGPPVLIVVQALIVALGALPLSWIVRAILRSELAAAIFPLAYLMHPMLQSATLDEFHPVTLAPTFLVFAIWYAYRHAYWRYILFGLLAMACKEQIGLIVALMSLSLAVYRWKDSRARIMGLSLAVSGVAWSFIAVGVIIPLASHGKSSPYWARLIYDSPPVGVQVTLRTVLQAWQHYPAQLWQTITLPAKGIFAVHLMSPVAIFALLAPDVLLLTLPSLGLLIVTREFHIYAGIGHYTAEYIPFVYLAALVGIYRIVRFSGRHWAINPQWIITPCCFLLVVATLLAGWQQGFTPLHAAMTPPSISTHARLAQQMLDLIPAQSAVSAEEGLGPHLGERPDIYLFPYLGPHRQARYVALDISGNSFPIQPVDIFNQAQALLASGKWGIRFAADGLLLLERGLHNRTLPPAFLSFIHLQQDSPSATPLARFGSALELIGYQLVWRPVQFLGYPVLQVTTQWRVLAPLPADTHIANYITDTDGRISGAWGDQAATDWFSPAAWKPGQTFSMQMHTADIDLGVTGKIDVDIAVFQGDSRDTETIDKRLTITPLAPRSLELTIAQNNTLLHLTSVHI